MTFGEKLQSLRKSRGMSQEALAEAVGVSRQAISKWESGQSFPETDKLISLSELFHTTIDSLLKDAAPKPAEESEEQAAGRNTQQEAYSYCRYSRHYEYKSSRTLFHIPLVHVNVGRGIHVAKGIVAIGNISVGVLSIGGIAIGGLALGGLSLGLIALAGIALGLLLAAGGLAVGTVALGGGAVGIFAIGGMAVGLYSMGGCAIASHIAIGGYASGHIAIGDAVDGVKTIAIGRGHFDRVSAEQVRALIQQEYPNLWPAVTAMLTSVFR